jgi:hypothetical protein
MAVNQSRSMTMDLFEGISDGVVKKLTPDRGGLQDSREAAIVKSDLHEMYDALYSQGHMMNASSRIAYNRGMSTPYTYPVGQDPACNVCGNTGCAC